MSLYLLSDGTTIYKPRVVSNPNGKETGTAGVDQIANCRCRENFLPFGIKPTERASRLSDGQVKDIKSMSFSEWEKTQDGIKSIEAAQDAAKKRASRLARKRRKK